MAVWGAVADVRGKLVSTPMLSCITVEAFAPLHCHTPSVAPDLQGELVSRPMLHCMFDWGLWHGFPTFMCIYASLHVACRESWRACPCQPASPVDCCEAYLHTL